MRRRSSRVPRVQELYVVTPPPSPPEMTASDIAEAEAGPLGIYFARREPARHTCYKLAYSRAYVVGVRVLQ